MLENRLWEIAGLMITLSLPVSVITLIVLAARRRSGPPVSALSVGSFVSSLFGPVGAVLGLALGVAALVQVKRNGMRGKAIAWAGIALAALWLAILLGGLIVYQMDSGSIVTGHL